MSGRLVHRLVTSLALGSLLAGCGQSVEGDERPATTRSPEVARPAETVDQWPASPPADTDSPTSPSWVAPTAEGPLAPAQPEIDDARAAAAGIRRVTGRRLILYTDLPPGDEIDRLPEVFEQAFPQWCAYFGIDPAEHPGWRATGCLMVDKDRFMGAGLLPDSLPPFLHGFNQGDRLWFYDQPSDYYRRHLLVHEGTHAFMEAMLGSCGPPWYMEGMAEMLATHRWENGRLTVGQIPASREESPHWGRVRIIKDAIASRRPMSFDEVVGIPGSAFLEVDAYAWSWAAVVLLERHPRYRERFHCLQHDVRRHDFNEQFRRLVGTDWQLLAEEWLVFVNGMEYGYDIGRTTVDFTPGTPLGAEGGEVVVSADQGWQNSGLRLERGAVYRLKASGRYQVATEPRAWWSEPGGVSIRYYQGKPLGILLAAVRDERDDPAASALLRPQVVGLNTTLAPEHSGTLYLKVNDSAAELAGNAGHLIVQVQPE